MVSHLHGLLTASAAAHPSRPATRIGIGHGWVTQSYAHFADAADRFGAALVRAGVQVGERVAILSANRPEWSVADFGCHAARAVTVPIYQTSTVAQVRHVLFDSGATVAIVGGADDLARVLAAGTDPTGSQKTDAPPAVRLVISLDSLPRTPSSPVSGEAAPTDSAPADSSPADSAPAESAPHDSAPADSAPAGSAPDEPAPAESAAVRVIDMAGFTRDLSDDDLSRLGERTAGAAAGDIATIIYTSGTTGVPAGVALSHAAILHQIKAVDAFFETSCEDSSLCFLPLSHALERVWTYFVFSKGALNTYVSDPKTVAAQLVAARPTMLVSVPKLYERVYSGARQAAVGSPLKARIFDWAMRVGHRDGELRLAASRPTRRHRVQLLIARKLVLNTIIDAIGGPKKVLAAGGAPLRREVEEFFWAAGQLVSQGYGLTEAGPLISFNCPSGFRFGSVGRVLLDGEVRIAESGEIEFRGPNVMHGYWNRPDKTEQTVVDGWLRTGDVGRLDDDGFLFITDRLKDIIVTLQGKNIAPAPIEDLIAADPLAEHVVLLGDNRPCLVALVAPEWEALTQWATEHGLGSVPAADLAGHPRVLQEFEARIATVGESLADYEKVRAFRMLPYPLTMDNGLLTPTLKVRRRAVEKAFSALIDDMYAEVSRRRR
jgi:long-chain acyl-CoA synthetase